MKILGNCVCTNASAQELPVLRPRREQPPPQQQQSDEQSLRDEIDELRDQWHFPPESAPGAVAEPEQQTHHGLRPAHFKHKHGEHDAPGSDEGRNAYTADGVHHGLRPAHFKHKHGEDAPRGSDAHGVQGGRRGASGARGARGERRVEGHFTVAQRDMPRVRKIMKRPESRESL